MIKNLPEDMIRFIKFAIVGISNTFINWIIFFALNSFGVYYIIANIISYIMATINSYFFNSKWVFKYNESEKIKAVTKFIILNISGLMVNTFLLYIFVDIVEINKYISLVIVTVIIMFMNYVINKIWVFK